MRIRRGHGRGRVVCLCAGVGAMLACTGCPSDGWTTGTELDNLNCAMTIVESDSQAQVTATISRILGLPVEMSEGQSVAVSDEELTGPDADHAYTATIASADTYVITVTEPTRGVETTSVDAPSSFDITSPAEGQEASLSGFTATWSNADADLRVTVRLVQTIFGQEHEFIGGKMSDDGSFIFTAADLGAGGFQQGADMTLTVRRIRDVSDIHGFYTGQVAVMRSESVQIVPAR